MFEKNKKELPEIIVPTLFLGGIQPKEAREGDIWVKDTGEEYEFYVYLGKWFSTKITMETGYTEKQKLAIKKYEKAKKSEQEKKIEKYEKFFKNLKEVLECMN